MYRYVYVRVYAGVCELVHVCMQVHSGITPQELSALLFETGSLIRTWDSPIRLTYKPINPPVSISPALELEAHPTMLRPIRFLILG